ncbi:MAG: ABC-2 family transporter protein [Verrucomicrobia bacterium]|nr:ABC-2 family transporter protein [Verrucomicrobiota bacterium]
MSFFKTVSFFFFLLRTSIRASISVRLAFLLEATLLVFNNFVFLVMWWIFFRQFQEISGWTMRDMIALNAMGMGGYGLMQVCFGGVRELSRSIVRGDLDLFMMQPKNLLLHLTGSKSLSKGWGHLLTALILIVLGGFITPYSLLLILIGIFSSCLVFASVAIIAYSAAFWFGSIEAVSRNYCNSVYLFALYPSNIYSGALQIVLFTLLPAGVIGYMPVELLRGFSWMKLITLLGSACSFFALAFLVFYRGLKRYESGNQFGVRY